MIVLFGSLAAAATLEDYLPGAPLTTEQATELLAADKIGLPARTYDQQSRASAATTEEQAIEAGLALGELAPSDSYRRFNRLYLELCRFGTPQSEQRWFLAEHVGLANIPELFVRFVVPKGDTAAVIDHVKQAMSEVRNDLEVRSIAVSVAEDPDEPGTWVGIGTVLLDSARFEPFPRVLEPGKIAVVPGTILDDKEKYALYVNFPGAEVREFPLQGAGEFDIEVPMPSEPGRYRVAMQRMRKGALPDSPFFFTLYVGIEPPVAFQASDWGITATPSARTDEIEQQFAAALSEARAPFERGPLEAVDGAASLRALLEGLPDGSERKRLRYLESALDKDPLPGVTHGLWTAVFGWGYSGKEAAWEVIEHPVTRGLVLDGQYDRIGVGAVTSGSRYEVLGILTSAVRATDESRQRVWDALAARWVGAPPRPSPPLEEGLDEIAASVAAGASLEKALKRVKPLAKRLNIPGYAVWGYVVAAGELPDLSKLQIPQNHRVLAIGDASGTASAGIGTTILLVVTATTAP